MSVDEHTIELAGTPVYYRSAPASGIPPLYVHGIPTSSDQWVAFLERTGGIAPDLIGFGRSGKAAYLDYSPAGLATFLTDLLAALDTDRVHLVAHGHGVLPALSFAAEYPERVERIVLISPPSRSTEPRLVRTLKSPILGELAMGSINRRLLARTLRRGGPWTEEQLTAVWEQFDQGTQRAILRLLRASGADPTRTADATHTTTPADLILYGEHDPWRDSDAPESDAAEPIPGAGHWPWFDRPEVIERVAQFLSS